MGRTCLVKGLLLVSGPQICLVPRAVARMGQEGGTQASIRTTPDPRALYRDVSSVTLLSRRRKPFSRDAL